MADLKSFDALLEATIKAPRLSGTKVKELSDQSMRLVANDHHIVTTFFRLNASLPPATQSRISSLYVFDAISRAARSAVHKGVGKEVRHERGKGSQAGLLLKMEGVVESWIGGLVDDGKGGLWVEGRDKTKKVIEIWTKGGTFPPACLARLSAKLKGEDVNGGANGGPAPVLTPPDEGYSALDQGKSLFSLPLPPTHHQAPVTARPVDRTSDAYVPVGTYTSMHLLRTVSPLLRRSLNVNIN
ncbi:hypothetical protein P7C73_g5584, partial [Tremellales sp. Uapishka_1]